MSIPDAYDHHPDGCDHKQPVFVHPVAEAPDQGHNYQRTHTGNHKQQGQLLLGDMQVIDRKRAPEGHHHKTAYREQSCSHKPCTVVALRQRMPKVAERGTFTSDAEMRVDGPDIKGNGDRDHGAERSHHPKRRFPSPSVGHIKTYGYSEYLTGPECHLYKPKHPPPLL